MVRVGNGKTEAIMSPIFNSSALHGLSNHALHRLRAALLEGLSCGHHLTEGDRCQFCAALQSVDAVLRSRSMPRPGGPKF
jgi:hypothetical protein